LAYGFKKSLGFFRFGSGHPSELKITESLSHVMRYDVTSAVDAFPLVARRWAFGYALASLVTGRVSLAPSLSGIVSTWPRTRQQAALLAIGVSPARADPTGGVFMLMEKSPLATLNTFWRVARQTNGRYIFGH
jgi:hypothetical protein